MIDINQIWQFNGFWSIMFIYTMCMHSHTTMSVVLHLQEVSHNYEKKISYYYYYLADFWNQATCSSLVEVHQIFLLGTSPFLLVVYQLTASLFSYAGHHSPVIVCHRICPSCLVRCAIYSHSELAQRRHFHTRLQHV